MKHGNATASSRPTLTGAALGLLLVCAIVAAALLAIAAVVVLALLLLAGVAHVAVWAF